jgi:hypothetical protein
MCLWNEFEPQVPETIRIRHQALTINPIEILQSNDPDCNNLIVNISSISTIFIKR